MHNQNEAFLHLNDALPADIARRRDMGDLAGALRLIDARLSSGVQPLLAPRLGYTISFAATLALVLGVAWAHYRWVEGPLARLRKKNGGN